MITTYLRTLRLFNRDVRLYMVTLGLIGFSYFGITSVLLNLYLLRLGYGTEFIGLVNGIVAVGFAGFSLPAGIIGERWGTRRAMISGVSLIVAAFALLPAAELVSGMLQQVWLLTARVCNGVGFALFMVNSYPFLMAATRTQERIHAFSISAALSPLAGLPGGLIAGILPGCIGSIIDVPLTDPAPYRYSLLIGAVLGLPAVPALLSIRGDIGERKRETAGRRSAAPWGLISFLGLVTLLRTAGEGVARPFFNVYLDMTQGVSTATIGVLTACGQGLAIPAALAMPYFLIRWGKVPTVVFSSLGMAVCLLVLALVPSWSLAGLAYMGVIAMLSLARSAYGIYQMEVVSSEFRPVMSGANAMAMGLGFASMAFGGGYIIADLGFGSLYLTGAGVVTVSTFVFWLHARMAGAEPTDTG